MSPMACLRAIRVQLLEQGAKRARLKSSGADAAAGERDFMKNMERNSFGIYDHPTPFRKRRKWK